MYANQKILKMHDSMQKNCVQGSPEGQSNQIITILLAFDMGLVVTNRKLQDVFIRRCARKIGCNRNLEKKRPQHPKW